LPRRQSPTAHLSRYLARVERVSDLAETLPVRTLDAMHLAAAERAGAGTLPFLTYDVRQAQVARSLGRSSSGGRAVRRVSGTSATVLPSG